MPTSDFFFLHLTQMSKQTLLTFGGPPVVAPAQGTTSPMNVERLSVRQKLWDRFFNVWSRLEGVGGTSDEKTQAVQTDDGTERTFLCLSST